MATAIEEDLFEVYYQPLYDLKEKRYRTMEALSRLRHPSLGMISPEVFIGIAEKHGQIAKLGYLQFRKVCKFIKEHPQIMEKIESIKYNLSPLELLKSVRSKSLTYRFRIFNLRLQKLLRQSIVKHCIRRSQISKSQEFRSA